MGERHVLTDKAIRATPAAPAGERVMLWDAVAPGLALRVTDKGHKSFVVQRRANGKLIKLTLGVYPALSLIKAREEARAALVEMTRGVDPRHRPRAPITASARRRDSFAAAIDLYLRTDVAQNQRTRSQEEVTRPLRKLETKWGSLSVSEITPRHVIEALDDIVASGAPIAANRTYAILHRFFAWCIERQLLAVNPLSGVAKPAKERSRDRVLSDDELAQVWRAAGACGWPFGPFVQGLILTGQRRNELAGLTRSELDWDERVWALPAERAKNGREHLVPLSAPMISLLRTAPRIGAPTPAGVADASLVFTTTGKTQISGFSRAKTQIDAIILETRRQALSATGADAAHAKPLADWRLHDLRRTCATGMGRFGVQPHIIEVVLNHRSGFRSGVAGVYQRHPYLDESRAALDLWSRHVVGLTARRDAAPNVVALRPTR